MVKYPFSFTWSPEIEAFFLRNDVYLLHPFKTRGIYRDGETVTLNAPISVEPFASMSGRRGFSNCGAFSYLHSPFGDGAEIGRYCSVAPHSRLMGNEHPLDRISTHPFACRDYYARWMERKLAVSAAIPPFAGTDRGRLIVQHDVWIGNAALLRKGVTIGCGAVVAAGAVVVKDVPAFAVVGGAPAKVIRYRFDDATIARILEVDWWRYHVRDLAGLDVTDIHAFLDGVESRAARGEIQEYRPARIDLAAAIQALTAPEAPRLALSAPRAARPAKDKPAYDASGNAGILDAIVAGGENDFSASPHHGRTGDIARNLIAEAAREQGWTIEPIRQLTYRVRGPDADIVFQQNAPMTAIGSSRITVNKVVTKLLLAQHGLATPVGGVFTDRAQALAYFRRRVGAQVVKPAFGGGGYGVTAGVTTEAALLEAWRKAAEYGRRIIVEDYVAGDEVRMITVGGALVAAVCRVPAFVIGDGAHTIAELVAEKNAARMKNPLLKIYPIKGFDQLRMDGRKLDEIPAKAERVRLSSVSNVALGGESVSVIDHLHPSIIAMAEQAARTLPNAILLGLDMLVKDFRAPADQDANVCTIEINSNPAIATAVFAAFGPPARDLPKRLLDESRRLLAAAKARDDGASAPAMVPAAAYGAPCGGDSFRRDYSTQMRLIRQAAYRRNLRVDALTAEITIVSDGTRRHAFFQGMSDRTPSIARAATGNKDWTKALLREAGIRVPEGAVFPRDAAPQAWDLAQTLGGPAVIKPIGGSGGNGVATDISTWPHFEQAWREARETGARTLIVEAFHRGADYRILAIGDVVRAAAQRIPAHVIGDGAHTIDQLIAIRNERRKGNPHDGSKPIKLTGMMTRNLAELGLDGDSVLESGRHVQLHAVANIGSGGESLDVSDRVHPDWAAIAAQIRRAVFNPLHIGFDLIAEDIARAPGEQRWAVIEVNANPDMGLHHFVTEGQPRDAAGALVEALFPQAPTPDAAPRKSAMIVTAGGGAMRRIWRQAHERGLDGAVRPLTEGLVEIVCSGAVHAVDDMIARCAARGPGRHADFAGEVPRGFAMAP